MPITQVRTVCDSCFTELPAGKQPEGGRCQVCGSIDCFIDEPATPEDKEVDFSKDYVGNVPHAPESISMSINEMVLCATLLLADAREIETMLTTRELPVAMQQESQRRRDLAIRLKSKATQRALELGGIVLPKIDI